ncbi:putative zinc ribbon protein [Natranaerovirga hydrolytica]|uniref:Putative zinc ribbon protein n=1 Tax=Natranaerovirga hydrolytica TaxID=680378 RepID=A0A4V2Q052_9FIRM|nr:zinc ribbon domain-containing protein [Natranaerovirga hydrolytica]TCK92451.1 putative zinc ribbon protein [Natranaerovirga hydrolytica]
MVYKNMCQSCGMPMEGQEKLQGTNKDGSKNEEYCKYCYQEGSFTKEETMEDMVETCIPFMVEEMTETEARTILKATLPKLKRWQ